MTDDTHSALRTVSRHAFEDEKQAVKTLLECSTAFRLHEAKIVSIASNFIAQVRKEKLSGIEAFQQEYGLGSEEGILMMCLAEALLRIPDKATADRLIKDKLSPGDWDRHASLGHSWLVNFGAHGLELAGAIASEEKMRPTVGAFLARLIHTLGEPLVRTALSQAMKLMGNAFVLAGAIEDALKRGESWHENGFLLSYDMLGEGARSEAQANEYFEAYLHAIQSLPASDAALYAKDGISIKLTALHPRVELRQWESLQSELLSRLRELIRAAQKKNVLITIDAEEATRLDVMLMLFSGLLRDPEFAGYGGLGLAVQAYQKRAIHVIDYLGKLARETGKRIPVRLVKGAYWDSEIKRAQVDGLENYPVFTQKSHTDLSYLACAGKLLAAPKYFYPQFATHNARTVASILAVAGDAEYEFQRLYGMGEALYAEVARTTGKHCRIYAPVGPAKSLLSYLIRRILENGANSSFVHGLMNENISASQLIELPFDYQESFIPLPARLYPDRKNSHGWDPGNLPHLETLTGMLKTGLPPAPPEAPIAACEIAFRQARQSFPHWKATPVEERAACLERLAELYQAHEAELVSLCVHEAGKTLADAVSEVREAIDYCYYYAMEARRIFTPRLLAGPTGEHNTLSLAPRGIIIAISPWNFPLAIFTGQVTAALVTGNCVIAKPAEQTPRIARRAIQLMGEAGIPKEAVQLLIGSGETIGQALVQDKRTCGVVFTGSTATARAINRALAARDASIIPLIAETGGQNCMIVDSSALIEQTVDDMILSAFGSAGQRCSALRAAFIQEEIADELFAVLKGAVAQLKVGDPAKASTDIGPVIDDDAYQMLEKHAQRMQKQGKSIARAVLPGHAASQRLVAPQIYEIPSLDILDGEVFGPILHVIRYPAAKLDQVIAEINGTGYGLTFGIQSRIDATIRYLSECIHAGNIYVNRPMTGAVVGVQPFGGHGLSGTGPKAGGPYYLPRFCLEQTLTVNIAAIGGNIELLS